MSTPTVFSQTQFKSPLLKNVHLVDTAALVLLRQLGTLVWTDSIYIELHCTWHITIDIRFFIRLKYGFRWYISLLCNFNFENTKQILMVHRNLYMKFFFFQSKFMFVHTSSRFTNNLKKSWNVERSTAVDSSLKCQKIYSQLNYLDLN